MLGRAETKHALANLLLECIRSVSCVRGFCKLTRVEALIAKAVLLIKCALKVRVGEGSLHRGMIVVARNLSVVVAVCRD